MKPTFHLLIDCKDQPGLIFHITDTIYSQGYNIVKNDEFVDQETSHFFMRTVISGEVNKEELLSGIKDQLPAGSNVHLYHKRKKNIVVLATKEHHCLGDLLIRNAFDELNANIVGIIANHDTLRSLTEKFNIPFHHIDAKDIPRHEHEEKVVKLIKTFDIDYIVLAKYMRILTPDFVSQFPGQIVNIHHSFLPAFIGANPYRQAYERGVKIIGATAHFVNDNLDEGPIIHQSVIPVNHRYNWKEMAQAGRDVEKTALAQALKLVFEDKVFVKGNKTIILD